MTQYAIESLRAHAWEALRTLEAASAPPRNDAERVFSAFTLGERIRSLRLLAETYQELWRLKRRQKNPDGETPDARRIYLALQDITATARGIMTAH